MGVIVLPLLCFVVWPLRPGPDRVLTSAVQLFKQKQHLIPFVYLLTFDIPLEFSSLDDSILNCPHTLVLNEG